MLFWKLLHLGAPGPRHLPQVIALVLGLPENRQAVLIKLTHQVSHRIENFEEKLLFIDPRNIRRKPGV
ncbi:MAG: hypothetical protein EBX52_13125, partial [Proteobacteria bacterium]|nr:hypothetical protein [Pseudomonadota bacterium]